MRLFNFLKEKKTSPDITVKMHGFVNKQEVKIQQINVPEEDQQAQWYSDHYQIIQQKIKPLESLMVKTAASINKNDNLDAHIKKLQEVIKTFYQLKNVCKSIDGAYEFYFSPLLEPAHNSRNQDFGYLDLIWKKT